MQETSARVTPVTATISQSTRHKPTVSELHFAVVFGDLYLEGGVFTHVCRQPGQTLTPAASDSHQQHVASGLTNHAHHF